MLSFVILSGEFWYRSYSFCRGWLNRCWLMVRLKYGTSDCGTKLTLVDPQTSILHPSIIRNHIKEWWSGQRHLHVKVCCLSLQAVSKHNLMSRTWQFQSWLPLDHFFRWEMKVSNHFALIVHFNKWQATKILNYYGLKHQAILLVFIIKFSPVFRTLLIKLGWRYSCIR